MTPTQFLASLDPTRKELLSAMHKLILQTNTRVKAEVGEMMGKQMLIYKDRGIFTYALSSVKSHMSLHLMPIYGCAPLHQKHSKLLNKAKFQKGCVNFKSAEEMPLDLTKNLLIDCSAVDMVELMMKFRKK
jgi:hypothetical protein